ncbi:hypothetical protein [Selenomonas felix]|nr:hypothetical protein [Selenomonas felix]
MTSKVSLLYRPWRPTTAKILLQGIGERGLPCECAAMEAFEGYVC